MQLFERAAQLGHGIGMNALGVIYDNGNGGVAKDFGLALYWFQQAADSGCVPAFKNLGIVYEVHSRLPRVFSIAQIVLAAHTPQVPPA
jgi:TPR repeat protein